MSDKWEKYGKIRAMYINGVSDRKIAKALGVGRRTVRKYRDGAVTPDDRIVVNRKATLKDTVEEDIKRMLSENTSLPSKQRLNAKDMWDILVSDHKIAISQQYVRQIVHDIRDAGGDEFIPLDHEIGDCMQIDWLEDVIAIIDGIRTAVQVFVCALPYSGAVCAFVYPDKKMLSFLHGHVKAMNWIEGVSRNAVYDNVKTAVYSGSGKNAVTQKTFQQIAQHYSFTPVFCNRAAGWEKSNAENGVKITRKKAFVPMPRVKDLDELQNHISACLLKYNMTHKIDGRKRTIWDMFQEERSSLAPLPVSPFEVDETIYTKVRPDQTVRYDKKLYSVPHGYVGKNVTLRVSPFELKVYYRGELLYSHKRLRENDPDQYVLDHYLESLTRKPRAVEQALPITKGVMPTQCKAFLELCPAADANKQLVEIMLLARDAGKDRVLAALDDAIVTGKPSAELVRYYLYGQEMPEDEFEIKHGDLSEFDKLIEGDKNENDE